MYLLSEFIIIQRNKGVTLMIAAGFSIIKFSDSIIMKLGRYQYWCLKYSLSNCKLWLLFHAAHNDTVNYYTIFECTQM